MNTTYPQFQDFIDYLDVWGAQLEQQLEQAHRHVAARLAKRILPQGVWRFPAQALLQPQKPVWQKITPAETSPAATPLIRKRKLAAEDDKEAWTPCGVGWTRPMETLNRSADASICRWTLRYAPQQGEPALFASECGLLIFIAEEEEAIAALSSAEWKAQVAGSAVSVYAERYEGYCEFEQSLRFAAQMTPALETCLPPCYPYSRKILHLRFSALGQAEGNREVVAISLTVKVAGEVGKALADRLQAGDDWLLLNPVPATQMQTDWRPTDCDRRMDKGKIEIVFDNLEGVFATVGVNGEGWEAAPFAQDKNQTRVVCGNGAREARVYFGSRGEIDPAEFMAADEAERRERLAVSGDPDRQFEIVLPPVGGMTSNFAEPTSDACRFWWHSIFLRSPMLTFGDLQELLRHLPDCRRYFDISRMGFCLEGISERMEEPTHWNTYLWPSRITEPFLSYQSVFQPRNPSDEATRTIPISPVIRLILPVKAEVALPDFLLKDIAHHAASYLEQYFALGWYRIVSEVAQ